MSYIILIGVWVNFSGGWGGGEWKKDSLPILGL